MYFVVLYIMCRYMYCVALYMGYRCMSCVVYQVIVYAFFVSHVVFGCMSCDVHCVRIRVVLCCTPSACICIVMCCTLGVGVCVVCQV